LLIGNHQAQGQLDGKIKANKKGFRFPSFSGRSKGHFGASQSRKPNESTATVPTPPSQSATNHNNRSRSGRCLCSESCPAGINDSRYRA
jgi:hypothetical protein